MYTNNENCTIQLKTKVFGLIKGKGILLHIDVAQSVSKIVAGFGALSVAPQAMHDCREKGFSRPC